MSSHFSANQYEGAFDGKRLQNWQLPKTYKERPSPNIGHTQIIANDRGHLLENAPRSKESAWGNFKGTWDMPQQIPGNVTTEMARTRRAANEIQRSQKEHEAFMKQPTGSPDKSPQQRPGNPSPHSSLEKAPSKSPTQTTPRSTPQPSRGKSPTTPQLSPADAETPQKSHIPA